MGTDKRTQVAITGAREAQRLAATLGGEIRAARRRRQMTIGELADRIGLHQARVGAIERGGGLGAPLRVCVSLGVAVGRPLAIGLSRDTFDRLTDAGHLAVQELVLRLARASGRHATFELPTRPADPSRSIDVGIRDDVRRALLVVEIWNRLDDLGAAMRRFDRTMAEAAALAVASGGDEPFASTGCWLLRDSAANRAIVARYPAILRSRFKGSSVGWVRALRSAHAAPNQAGLLWATTDATRLVPLRWRRE